MKKGLFVIGGVILIAFIYLITQGLFFTPVVKEGVSPGFHLMGLDHYGPYENIGDAFSLVSEAGIAAGIPNPALVGVYFDHPDSVPKEKLHAYAALIVQNETDSLNLSRLNDIRPMYIPAGATIECIIPTSGMVSMIIAAMKAYPALTEAYAKGYTDKEMVQVYEVYEEGQTRFVMQFK
jgi:hypothetical protein